MEPELEVSALMPPPNSELTPTIVLARGGFTLTLNSVDCAKVADAIASLNMEAAREDAEMAGPEPPLVEDDEDDEIVAP